MVGILLARLLPPEDFGAMASLALFTALAGILADSGMSAAIIQRQALDDIDRSTAFWLNSGLAIPLACGLIAIGPILGVWMHYADIQNLAIVMSFNLVVTALGATHQSLLVRSMNFRLPTVIGGIATLAASAIAVWMALVGYGVWALAAQVVLTSSFTTLLLWITSQWRPSFAFSTTSARSLFGYGGYLGASALIDVAFARGSSILIGGLYGMRDLGFYNRAEFLAQLPSVMLFGVLNKVAFATFSRASGDRDELRRQVGGTLSGVTFLVAPAAMGLLVTAEPLVAVLLGPNWAAAAPILTILSGSLVTLPIMLVNMNLIMALGHSREFLVFELVRKSFGVALLVAGSFIGLHGIAIATVVTAWIGMLVSQWFCGRLFRYGLRAQLRDVAVNYGCALGMAIVVAACRPLLQGLTPVPELILLVAVGVTAYATLTFFLNRKAFVNIMNFIYAVRQ